VVFSIFIEVFRIYILPFALLDSVMICSSDKHSCCSVIDATIACLTISFYLTKVSFCFIIGVL
jgi:hypothetical protein